MVYYIYIINCIGNRFYTGITTDYKRRFLEHKLKKSKAAQFTKMFPCIDILLLYKTEGRSNALKLEYRIKQLKKADKELLINNHRYFKKFFSDYIDIKQYKRVF